MYLSQIIIANSCRLYSADYLADYLANKVWWNSTTQLQLVTHPLPLLSTKSPWRKPGRTGAETECNFEVTHNL